MTLMCRGREIDLSCPVIMGILNVTPDSFSDGGRYLHPDDALRRASELTAQGADIIDIGGQSTRPGHTPVSPDEEWSRIAPVIARIAGIAPISVDTYYPEVARKALDAGADIINDVTGFRLPEMRRVAAQFGAGCIVMHDGDISGAPLHDTPALIRRFFRDRIADMIADGVDPRCVCLDCGVGFGKTRDQEDHLLDRMNECGVEGFPMLIGASRKRLICHLLGRDRADISLSELDAATHAAHLRAVRSGADIVRVHDVSGARTSLDTISH